MELSAKEELMLLTQAQTDSNAFSTWLIFMSFMVMVIAGFWVWSNWKKK